MKRFYTYTFIVLLLLTAVGVVFFVKSKQGSNIPSQVTKPTPTNNTNANNDIIRIDIQGNKNTLMAKLEDVSGGASNGVGYILRENEKLTHEVVANLPDPTGSDLYEGWLVKKTPKLEFFSTGVMKKTEDGKYELRFSSPKEHEGYSFLVITLETVIDETPEKHILEGIAQ